MTRWPANNEINGPSVKTVCKLTSREISLIINDSIVHVMAALSLLPDVLHQRDPATAMIQIRDG